MKTAFDRILLEGATELLEGLALKSHIANVKKAANQGKIGGRYGLNNAEQISGHVIPIGEDSVTIPLNRSDSAPHPAVENELNRHGYTVSDYGAGLAQKSDGSDKRQVKIGKLLDRHNSPQSIKTLFQKDPNRAGLDSSAKIVISRKPEHVGGMSTHQNWESCQTLGGSGVCPDTGEKLPKQDIGKEAQYVFSDVKHGSHIAYLVHNEGDVDKHYGPIARTLLKPYHSTINPNKRILRPSGVYGDDFNGFHKSVNDWAEKHFPATDPEYRINPNVYQEGPMVIRNFAHEHDAYWSDPKNASSVVALTHPSKVVHDAYMSMIDNHAMHHLLPELAKNPHVSPEIHEKMFDHMDGSFNNMYYHGQTIKSIYGNTKSHALLARGVRVGSADVAANPNLSPDQIHELYTKGKGKDGEVSPIDHAVMSNQSTPSHVLNDIASRPETHKYPSTIMALAKHKNFSDSEFERLTQSIVGSIKPDHSEYFGKGFALIGEHRPFALKHLTPLNLYHGYNNSSNLVDTPNAEDNIEKEMLRRAPENDFFAKHVAKNSDNKERLLHIATSGAYSQEAADNATKRLNNKFGVKNV